MWALPHTRMMACGHAHILTISSVELSPTRTHRTHLCLQACGHAHNAGEGMWQRPNIYAEVVARPRLIGAVLPTSGPGRFCGVGKMAWYNLLGYRISSDSTRIFNRILPVTRLHIHVFYPCTLVYTITEYKR